MTQVFSCPVCQYPSRLAAACDNPGCVANPCVSQEQKDRWLAARERREADEAERQRVRDIRRRATRLK